MHLERFRRINKEENCVEVIEDRNFKGHSIRLLDVPLSSPCKFIDTFLVTMFLILPYTVCKLYVWLYGLEEFN